MEFTKTIRERDQTEKVRQVSQGCKTEVKSLLVGVSGDTTESFGKHSGVTVLTSWAYFFDNRAVGSRSHPSIRF